MSGLAMKSFARCQTISKLKAFSPTNLRVSLTFTRFDQLQQIQRDSTFNIPDHITFRLDKKLYQVPSHPLNIIKQRIVKHFAKADSTSYKLFEDLSPIVSTKQNFDDLEIPADHSARSASDTYYVNKNTLLRTHTSAHQNDLLAQGEKAFFVVGDVYRRDTVDTTHMPVFHQMEGLRVFSPSELSSDPAQVEAHMKSSLEGLIHSVFGNVKIRWIDAYFPFTLPSYEIEIFFNGQWLEVLGCGVVHENIMKRSWKEPGAKGWAFGLGLERLAMVLFRIPDVRLFWTEDNRFLSQFTGKEEEIVHFKPYSKDISFWIPEQWNENDFFDIVRKFAADRIESVAVIDEFSHPKTGTGLPHPIGRKSLCYRITYRDMNRPLSNEEINVVQGAIKHDLISKLGVEVR